MRLARFFDKRIGSKVKCTLCPHNCVIADGKVGVCGVRQNIKGRLFSLVYAQPIALNVDPIEKKPLYHYLPGTKTFSLGTIGCNLGCLHCQNYTISKTKPKKVAEYTPEKIVELALENDCDSISYTYTEPIIFYEYLMDTAKIAKRHKLKNIIVSNGFINLEPLKRLVKNIDAANIDLKAFNERFYQTQCKAKLEPVKNTIEFLNGKVWLEITNLIIPKLNDDLKEIEKMVRWIANINKKIPLHFSAYYPSYKTTQPPTQTNTLEQAKKIADKYLDYVYLGNIGSQTNTNCPKCKKLLISRSGFGLISNKIKNNKCQCGHDIVGIYNE
ncbi:AmmeMemoRadiSam system radical SAM enzyme [Candidatus Woesearchaeota archaeon]|nr:AmmeMemoRadiSam system radical SAM enzyme [Candidatus Woesearchaeota archaeon]